MTDTGGAERIPSAKTTSRKAPNGSIELSVELGGLLRVEVTR